MHINAAEPALNQSYLQVSQKINKAIEDNIPPEEIFENLSKSEISILMGAYSSDVNDQTYGLSSELINNPEVKLIDDLASKYYNYYLVFNTFPDNFTNNFSEMNDSSAITMNEGVLDYSQVMKDIGYTFTVSDIAIQLAKIGLAMNIGTAFHFLGLVSLVVGMGLIAFTAVTIAYCGVAVGVNNLILTWYTRSAQQLLNARTSTATLVAQKEKGAVYWEAYRVNYMRMGGIRVSKVLNEYEALGIVKLNHSDPNVLAVNVNAAMFLGSKASPRYGITMDKPHNSDKQPLNMYHVHANVAPGVSGLTHIFYVA